MNEDDRTEAERERQESKEEGVRRGDPHTPPEPGGGKPGDGEREDSEES